MKKTRVHFRRRLYHASETTRLFLFTALMCGLLLPLVNKAQQSYTFTNCTATGSTGPTQAMVTAAYSGTNGVVQVNVQGVQQWTVPATSLYRIEAWGATAGTARTNGNIVIDGRGRKISGEVILTANTVLSIVVGQQGIVTNQQVGGGNWKSGGGGASWVYSVNTPYMIAGGGGGAGEASTSSDAPFNATFFSGTSYHAAVAAQTNVTLGAGGQAGGVIGGLLYATGAGGAGWNSDGVESTTNRQGLYNNRGKCRLNGFIGGTASNFGADGGFGGGAAGVDNTGAGGRGGGYTGGPGGEGYTST